LCAKALDTRIKFNLPFANMTKGEVLATLTNHELHDWLQASRSCIHSSMRLKSITHCGICPACIERRQAFDVAEIADNAIYRDNIFESPPDRGMHAAYFRLYQDEASAWLAGRPRSQSRFEAHLQMTGIDRACWAGMRALRGRHSREVMRTYA